MMTARGVKHSKISAIADQEVMLTVIYEGVKHSKISAIADTVGYQVARYAGVKHSKICYRRSLGRVSPASIRCKT